MSLTREQWEEMWAIVKAIKNDSDYLYFTKRRDVSDRIKRRCERIEELIQSVIGQME